MHAREVKRIDQSFLHSLTSFTREIDPLPITYSYSDTQFEIIKQYIQEFEASLDADHEVGLLLTNFGQTMLMEVTHIWYEKSVLMVFHGYVNGRKSTLIQHISQLNFLLTSVPRNPERPSRKIGFVSNWEDG